MLNITHEIDVGSSNLAEMVRVLRCLTEKQRDAVVGMAGSKIFLRLKDDVEFDEWIKAFDAITPMRSNYRKQVTWKKKGDT